MSFDLSKRLDWAQKFNFAFVFAIELVRWPNIDVNAAIKLLVSPLLRAKRTDCGVARCPNAFVS